MPDSHSIPHHLSTPPHRLSPPPISDRLTQSARREAGGRGRAGSLERRMRILCVIKSEPWRERGGTGGGLLRQSRFAARFPGDNTQMQTGHLQDPAARKRGPPAGGCDAFGRPAPRAARVLRGPGRVSPVPTSRAGGRAGTARAETGRDVAGREGDYRPFRARSSATRSGAATTRSPTMPACSSKWQ